MRLHDYIITNREQILAEWETFARTCAPASTTMDVTALRDHADEMLSVIVTDLRTSQNWFEQSEKSKGLGPGNRSVIPTAAEEHGAGRAESGFSIEQMVAEYRALRASVLRLWTRTQGELKPIDVEDLTRFNEAIDQSLAESVGEFNENVEKAKEMFLAILGHDLRTPLGAIFTSAKFMLETGELTESHRALTERIASSATRTVEMVGDLLDFTRSRLGGGIPVHRQEMNLTTILHDLVEEISAAHPERTFELDLGQEQRGEWDAGRIAQAIANLIGNAVEYGEPGTPVTIGIGGDAQNVAIGIHNHAFISADRLDGIFYPLKTKDETLVARAAAGPTGNLGLGLYIAERIVNAHGGRIEVESSPVNGTTFSIHMPRYG